jgi:hypothetical protein
MEAAASYIKPSGLLKFISDITTEIADSGIWRCVDFKIAEVISLIMMDWTKDGDILASVRSNMKWETTKLW